MRVISGKFRGRRLRVPDRKVRPTTDRVREALFSILGEIVLDARVLDLFAGSGALGIEACSRGASSLLAIDSSRLACQTIEKNFSNCSLEAQTSTLDVFAFLRSARGEFDLIFADPPYPEKENLQDSLAGQLLQNPCLPSLLSPDGFLVIEVSSETEISSVHKSWNSPTIRNYGKSKLMIYQKTSCS